MRLAAVVICLCAGAQAAGATSVERIEALFQQFDGLVSSGGQAPVPSGQDSAVSACEFSLSETQSAIDTLANSQAEIERRVTTLDSDYDEIADRFPRLGGAPEACNPRNIRMLDEFRTEISALDLPVRISEADGLTACIVDLRQRLAAWEARLDASSDTNAITEKLQLNNQKKQVTDLDAKRNEFAIFLEQAQGLLGRRLDGVNQAYEVNCTQGGEL